MKKPTQIYLCSEEKPNESFSVHTSETYNFVCPVGSIQSNTLINSKIKIVLKIGVNVSEIPARSWNPKKLSNFFLTN